MNWFNKKLYSENMKKFISRYHESKREFSNGKIEAQLELLCPTPISYTHEVKFRLEVLSPALYFDQEMK